VQKCRASNTGGDALEPLAPQYQTRLVRQFEVNVIYDCILLRMAVPRVGDERHAIVRQFAAPLTRQGEELNGQQLGKTYGKVTGTGKVIT
jgi:hypothetical protein